MRNIETAVKGNILTIKVDLSKEGGLSASGKTVSIGSSKGNKEIDGADGVYLGINVYRYPKPKA